MVILANDKDDICQKTVKSRLVHQGDFGEGKNVHGVIFISQADSAGLLTWTSTELSSTWKRIFQGVLCFKRGGDVMSVSSGRSTV